MALISVILPVYNGEQFIAEAVTSILEQTFQDLILYVIDDGSTDNTVDILKQFKDDRLVIIRNEANKGLIYTLNKGLELASSSKYIARMDADDISTPNRLQLQYDFMEKNPNIGILGGAMLQFGGTGGKQKVILRPNTSTKIASTFLFYNPMSHPTVMIRTTQVHEYFSYDFPKYEDYHLWIKLFQWTDFHNLDTVILKYRRHDYNVTSTYAQNVVEDHSYIIKLIDLFCSMMKISLTSDEKNTLSIISSRVRYSLQDDFKVEYLRTVKHSILSKLNQSFDPDFFEYLFEERALLYFVSLNRFKDGFIWFLRMNSRFQNKVVSSYIAGGNRF